MSVTINVNNLSLCHKGSNGVSTATIPDVCKTPSPGGPVPIPYPNISLSSDLANGTTTVTADGGNSIAIKGSEFSRSTGDEPGTIGGVKSNVNMKESKWLLYSFDVKMDGANACRLTDKKTQNHENTVDATGEIQAPLVVATFDLNIDCAAKKADTRPGKAWDDCMVEELCNMVSEFNKVPKDKVKRVRPSPSSPSSPDYATYSSVKDTFAGNFGKLVKAEPPDEAAIKNQFSCACRYDKWNAGTPPPARNPSPAQSGLGAMSPDHVHDVGLGGPFGDVTAMKWVNSRVNTTCGAAMRPYNPDTDRDKSVTASKCCN